MKLKQIGMLNARRSQLLVLVTVLLGLTLIPRALGQNSIELSEVKLRLGDGILVIFLPPVSGLSSTVNALGNMTYLYAVFTNEQASLVRSLGGYEASIVEVIPKTTGRYNVFINFTANNATKLLYGMVTNNASFYGKDLKTYPFSQDNVFVMMRPTISLSPSNGTLLFTVNVIALSSGDSSIFSMILPPFSKIIFIVLFLGLLAYWNAYVILDTYFLSKVEHVSNMRKALVALSLGISALLVYIYVFG
ncbi:MAG: hypothetical protein QXF26_10325 [Candidatus Bathyarchaeia archaeon]